MCKIRSDKIIFGAFIL